MAAPKKYPDELRERAVRLCRESEPKPVIRRLAEQLGVHHEALRNWIRQDEADRGERADRPSTDMLEENRRLKRENTELKRVNEVLRAASAYFASRDGGDRQVPLLARVRRHLRVAAGMAGAAPSRDPGRPQARRADHARARPARRVPAQGLERWLHQAESAPEGRTGPGQPAVRRRRAEPTLGRRPDPDHDR